MNEEIASPRSQIGGSIPAPPPAYSVELTMIGANQEPVSITISITGKKSGHALAVSRVEAVSEEIDQLGTPYIDDANPNTAGKIWLRRLLEAD